MTRQMDFTEEQPEPGPAKKARARRKKGAAGDPAAAGAGAAAEGDARGPAAEGEGDTPAVPEGAASEAEGVPPPEGAPGEAAAFADVAHLTRKGLRVVSVVTGAVVDEAGNFLFYLDGHEDARSGVQAQVNHLLGSGPAREEHLGPARARARELLDRLTRPRGG